MGVFGLGEGWHNNHHAFPRAAEHGLEWWQIDISAYVIRLLEKTKLVCFPTVVFVLVLV